MTFLPIVARELRVAARRRGTYWTRVVAALVASCAVGWILSMSNLRNSQSPSDLSRNIFMMLCVFAFIYSLFSGARNTADCLSEEKREGTLGLLFLTDLKGYDVVLGKLVATSMTSVYGLLAIFPVLAIPLLLGGVTMAQFWRTVLMLGNTLFFSLAAGMLISSLCRQPREAVGGTLMLVLFVAGGLPLGGVLYDQFLLKPPHGEPPLMTLMASPGYAFYLNSSGWTLPSVDPKFWGSLLTTHLLSWGMLGFASAWLPHAWQDRPASSNRIRWRERWKQWSYGSAEERKAFRERLLNVNPFFWLAGRNRLKPAYVWAFLGVTAVVWLWGLSELKNDWLDEATFIMTALFLHSTLKIWLTTEACQRLNQDRQSGALELLLSTPLSVKAILRGQLLALRRQFLWPIVLVLLVDSLFLVNLKDTSELSLMFLAGMAMLVADVVALSWVGMWMALRAKDPNRAAGLTIARLLVLPWVIFYIGAVLVELLPRRPTFAGDHLPIVIWFALGIFFDLIFCVGAYNGLNAHFRSLATQRYEPSGPAARWWRFWSRKPNPPATPIGAP